MLRQVSPESLRSAGLKVTQARRTLLRVLESSPHPLTVDEIVERLPVPRPGRPTIYRNLERFIQEAWVESFVDRNQVQRFLRCGSTTHHHHIHCERCRRTAELDGCALQETLGAFERQTGFLVTRHQLQVYGLCPECQKSPRPAKKGGGR